MTRLGILCLLLVASAAWGSKSSITRADSAYIDTAKSFIVMPDAEIKFSVPSTPTGHPIGALMPPVYSAAPSTSVARNGMLFYDTDTDSLYVWRGGVSWRIIRLVDDLTMSMDHLYVDSTLAAPKFSSAPSVSMAKRGAIYIDTDTDSLYISTGTAWRNVSAVPGTVATQLTSPAGTSNTAASIEPDTIAGTPLFTGKPTLSAGFSTGASPSKITDIAPFDAIVDSAGNGDYTAVQAAINAGHRRIFIRRGTYDPFDADQNSLWIQGAGKRTVINGGTTDDAIDITGDTVYIADLAVITGAGGTCGGGACCGVNNSSGGYHPILERITVLDADDSGLLMAGYHATVNDCMVVDADGVGIETSNNGVNLVGNIVYSSGATGIAHNTAAGNGYGRMIGNWANAIDLTHGAAYLSVIGNQATVTNNGSSTNEVAHNTAH